MEYVPDVLNRLDCYLIRTASELGKHEEEVSQLELLKYFQNFSQSGISLSPRGPMYANVHIVVCLSKIRNLAVTALDMKDRWHITPMRSIMGPTHRQT